MRLPTLLLAIPLALAAFAPTASAAGCGAAPDPLGTCTTVHVTASWSCSPTPTGYSCPVLWDLAVVVQGAGCGWAGMPGVVEAFACAAGLPARDERSGFKVYDIPAHGTVVTETVRVCEDYLTPFQQCQQFDVDITL